MSDSEEEMVAAYLGDDYEKGPFFTTDWGPKDYLVPRSQLERWEAARAAYEVMQSEIEQVMDEQRERVRALNARRPKGQIYSFIQDIYGPLLQQRLEQSAFMDKVLRKKESE